MLIIREWKIATILILVISAIYGSFLSNPIVFDDLAFFMLDNEGNQPVSVYHFSLFQLRSLPYATLAWTKTAFGLDLINFRVGNLLLHHAVTLSLFSLLLNLFNSVYAGQKNTALSYRTVAFFAALLFALHPVVTYAVGYLVQRTIIMATLFSVLSLLTYVLGSIRQKIVWLWLSVPFYYLAVFSKEHAVMLPAVLLAITILLHADWRIKLKQRWSIFAALAGIAIFAILLKGPLGLVYEINAPEMLLENSSGLIGEANDKFTFGLSIITQSWLFFKYVFLWVIPNPTWMSIDMREPFARSLISPYLLALCGFLAWGVGAVYLLLKRGPIGLLGFGLLFPWLMFFTEFSTVRIQEEFVLYRSYLWAVGAFCILPVIISKLDKRIAGFILATIALAMMPISMERLKSFSHPLLLWDDAEKLVNGRTDLPGAYRIYYNRGTELIKIGKTELAIADLKQSVALSKDFAEAYGNMGAAYFKQSDWQQAINSFTKAIDIAHSNKKYLSSRYVYGRAMAYEKTGEIQKAIDDYKQSCQSANKGCEKIKSLQVNG